MKKYIITFLITSTIFISAFFVSDRVNVTRLEQLDSVQEKISLNILATETRFALLKESSCENIFEGSQLEIGITKDLNRLVTRIKFLENELGSDNEDVQILKQRYTLLQINDFLLVRELSRKCNYTIPTVLYFHTSDCFDCRKQSIVLDQIRSEYDQVRVYWVDASIHESTTDTLERLHDVTSYPSIVLGNELYSGFVTYEDFLGELSSWAHKNDTTLLSEEGARIIDLGREHIHSLENYSILQLEDIQFNRIDVDTDVYEYSISLPGGEGIILVLDYNEEKNNFSLYERDEQNKNAE